MIPFSVLYGVSNQCNHLEKVYLGTEEAKTFVAATVFEKTVVHLAKDLIYTMLTQRRSQSQLLISQNPTVIEYTMISRRVRSLFSSSRSWSRRFSLIICLRKEIESTSATSSCVPSNVGSQLERLYLEVSSRGLDEIAQVDPPRSIVMDSVRTSCPFGRAAFSLIERSLRKRVCERPSSVCGVAVTGRSRSKKSKGCSVRVRTRGGVFNAKGSVRFDVIRSKSLGLELFWSPAIKILSGTSITVVVLGKSPFPHLSSADPGAT